MWGGGLGRENELLYNEAQETHPEKHIQFVEGFNEWRHLVLIRMADERRDTERRRSCEGCRGLHLSVSHHGASHRCLCCISAAREALFSLTVCPPPPPSPQTPSLPSLCLPLAFPQINTQAPFITIHQVSLRHASLLCSLQLCRERRTGSRRGTERQERSYDKKRINHHCVFCVRMCVQT